VEPGENLDDPMLFPQTIPGGGSIDSIRIMNSTATPLKFEWRLYVPPPSLPNTEGLPGALPQKKITYGAPRLQANDSVKPFFVSMEKGELPALKHTDFEIQFKPLEVLLYVPIRTILSTLVL
jgi:hypothetical protein